MFQRFGIVILIPTQFPNTDKLKKKSGECVLVIEGSVKQQASWKLNLTQEVYPNPLIASFT